MLDSRHAKVKAGRPEEHDNLDKGGDRREGEKWLDEFDTGVDEYRWIWAIKKRE